METLRTEPEQRLVDAALGSWKAVIKRADKVFSALTDEQLQTPVGDGKNRMIYLWGHLIAVHDAMFPLLDLGERLHRELDAVFLSSPDRAMAELPSRQELKESWDEVNAALLARFTRLTADQWSERHMAVSAEDFAKDPSRNRLAVLLSRTNHASFHLGQAILAETST